MKDVKRQTVSGTQVFDMKLKRSAFLVKNLTEGDILVWLGETAPSSDSEKTKIPSMCFEVVFNNIEDATTGTAEATDRVNVTATTSGEVEVASVDF